MYHLGFYSTHTKLKTRTIPVNGEHLSTIQQDSTLEHMIDKLSTIKCVPSILINDLIGLSRFEREKWPQYSYNMHTK